MEINTFTEITRFILNDEYELDEIEKIIEKTSNNVLEDNDIRSYQALLYNLIKYDRTDILDILIKYIDIDIQESETGFTVLIAAIKHFEINNLEQDDYMFDDKIVLQLSKYTNNINIIDEDGYTALDHILKSLSLHEFYNLNRNDSINNIIKIMLKKGADVFMNDCRLIEQAIINRNHDILLLFLENTNDHKICIYLLYMAIRYLMPTFNNKNYYIFNRLIQLVYDINKLDNKGNTILDWYCLEYKDFDGSEKIKELLIEHGAIRTIV